MLSTRVVTWLRDHDVTRQRPPLAKAAMRQYCPEALDLAREITER